jgi:hypothetical protein
MSLETGNYIFNLDSSNPTGADPKSRGDDHFRLIKSVVKNSFAGFTGAVIVTGNNGGAVNAYTLTPATPLPSYVVGMEALFFPTVTNTGACTLNISGLGDIPLVAVNNAVLVANDLVVSRPYRATFDGTNFRLNSVTKNYIDQLAFNTALPAQNLGFLRSTGAVAVFSQTHTGYAQKEVRGADIASAATLDLTTATGNFLHITGNAGPITAITLASGAEYTLVFDSNPTLTNSASLILPGGANIAVQAGDALKVRGEPSSVARVVSYQNASGQALIPSAIQLLAQATVSSPVAAIDFLSVFSATYDRYTIEIENLGQNGAGTMQMRFANGGVIDAASNYYDFAADAGTMSNTQSLTLNPNIAANTLGSNFTIEVRNANASSASNKSVGLRGMVYSATVPARTASLKEGAYVGGAISGFRIFPGASQSITGATIRIYGHRNS